MKFIFAIITSLFILFTSSVSWGSIDGKGMFCEVDKKNKTNYSYPNFKEEYFFFFEDRKVRFNNICNDFESMTNNMCIGLYDIAKYNKKRGNYFWSNSNQQIFTLNFKDKNLLIAHKENDGQSLYDCEVFKNRKEYFWKLNSIINNRMKEHIQSLPLLPKS